MSAVHLAGWSAGALTLATYVCPDNLFQRALAICANAVFISCGAVAWLLPVLALHLPWRLLELIARQRGHHAPGATMTNLRV